ncbi:MAG: translation initiation factor IF-2 [Bacteroidetes bacterium]|nr:translation initiation factor IF-2 [Bacteroidota bacterium]
MAEENKVEKPKATLIKHSKKTLEPVTVTTKSAVEEKPVEKKRVVVVKKKKVVVKKPTAFKPEADQRKTSGAETIQTSTPKRDNTELKTDRSVNTGKPEKVLQEKNDQQIKPGIPQKRDESDQKDKTPFRSRTPDSTSRRPSSDQARTNDFRANRPRPAGTRVGTLHGRPVSNDRQGDSREQRPRPQGGSDRPPYNQGRPQGGSDRPPYNQGRPQGGSDRPPYNQERPQGSPGAGRPPYNQGRPQGSPGAGRPPYNQGRPQGGPGAGRPPYNQGRPQGGPGTGGPGRFNRSRPDGGDKSPVPQENQKTVKKVFKPKNKRQRDFQKKREGVLERNFQIKKKTINTTNPIPKKIDMMEVITVSELAKKMNLKASELIGKLMSMGMMVTINQQIDSETAQMLAEEYGCKVNVVSLYEETLIKTEEDPEAVLKHRPPIVTVMGHVDHGKTKLLDAIRETNVVAGEFGGITQHIGAYQVQVADSNIVFLDTPGHSAFTLMRARGAQVTDIVILVVAANDGVMPQTKEAIDHAKEAGVPIIVAINKIDLPEANPERVKQQLSEYDLLPEDWGGSTLYCEISALKREGIDELLDMILLQAEMLELNANYACRAEGKVIESKVDHGRGIVSTVIIQKGTLKVGDSFIAGVYSGKVRAIFNDKGEKIDSATPSTPAEILGFTGIPNAGAPFQVTENEKQARQIGAKRQELERQGVASNVKKVTLDNLFDSIQEGEIQELKVIIKGDVHGSVEALQSSLEKLSTPEVRLIAIRASAGAIIEDDINLASASNAIVIGFNVRPTPKAKLLGDREKIDIRKYNIIYDAVDDMKLAMEGLLSPDIKEEIIGKVEVRDVFKVPKIGLVAGCYVLSGKVVRNAQVHIIRDSIEQYSGKVSSLRRFKDDAKEVLEGFECGLGVDNYQDIKVGDILEVFQIVEIAKKLT